MALTNNITYSECNLQLLMDIRGWNIEEAAEALGDMPDRLKRVLDGLEPLGRTATLAAIAIKNDLDAINS